MGTLLPVPEVLCMFAVCVCVTVVCVSECVVVCQHLNVMVGRPVSSLIQAKWIKRTVRIAFLEMLIGVLN